VISKLRLSIAIGDYDRNRPLIDGTVAIDGVEPIVMTLSPEEIFFRAMRHEAFDVCELSLSSFVLRTARGDCPYVGIPAFVSRAFRHTFDHRARRSRITKPQDLKGKRVGTPEWQLTANVWARALLEEDYGVRASDIRWVRGGLEEPGRLEKLSVTLPAGVRARRQSVPARRSMAMASGGRDRRVHGPARAELVRSVHNPTLRWVFDDPTTEAMNYFRRTRIFPIMHLVGVRRSIVERHPWLPMTSAEGVRALEATGAAASLGTHRRRRSRCRSSRSSSVARHAFMGEEFWPYGLPANRHGPRDLRQAPITRRHLVAPGGGEELFHPASLRKPQGLRMALQDRSTGDGALARAKGLRNRHGAAAAARRAEGGIRLGQLVRRVAAESRARGGDRQARAGEPITAAVGSLRETLSR
jgi:4,5-dihydroxyphthalate decarboxylase